LTALASASPTRARILRSAGIEFDVDPSKVDEDELKSVFVGRSMTPKAVAGELAAAKALDVSSRRPDLVIGADQTLDLEGEMFNKARDIGEARRCLLRLRGRTHRLYSGAALARAGNIIWQYTASVSLTMRAFSDSFLDRYLACCGESLQGSLGCYHYEGAGIQLFDKVIGDYHAILGLPLVRLLDALRVEDAAPQ
jgi:septum formation protein